MTGSPLVPIDARSVLGFLDSLFVDVGERPEVHTLEGGVSGTVLLVEGTSGRVVVKQALEQLRVEAEWFATPTRAVTEAAALSVLHARTPANVPELIGVSAADCAFVMTAAPASWGTWKERLLHGAVERDREQQVARRLGSVLAGWHRGTADDAALAERFADYDAFEQLRVTPFHRAVLDQSPPLTPAIERCIADLTETRQCLVHGDFSPKNFLVGPVDDAGLWVLDFEVAHYGAAVFDLAFLHTHLLLKGIHRPEHARALQDVAMAFRDEYARGVGVSLAAAATTRLGWHTACILLARVSGTSPAGYLTEEQAQQAHALAARVLSEPDRPIEDIWALLHGGRP